MKNGNYPILPSIVPEGDFGGIKGDQRNRNVPWNVNKNKVHLVLKINLHTNGKW
jgi:hypothetical protein